MQDRFRFRLYDKEKNLMLYEDSEELRSEKVYEYEELWWSNVAFPIKAISRFFEYNYEERFVLQQCTGLKDKNGKLIFEGDVLRYPPEDKNEEKNYVSCEVFFHDNNCCDKHIGFQMNRFRFHGNICGIYNFGNKYDFVPQNVEQMEIIGNVYENLELVEVQCK